MSNLPLYNPCPCGSGKEYGQCCAEISTCQVIHFPRGKRSNYRSLIESALLDLIDYARKYFPSWENAGQAKFLSYSQGGEINPKFAPLFWEWYVLNYRFYNDVSPLIDFYFVEMEDILTSQAKMVYESLKHSFISIFQVTWIRNNTVAARDIFCGEEHIIERDFGSVTQFIEAGTLLLTRMIKIGNISMVTGRPIIVNAEQKAYLCDEVNSLHLAQTSGEIGNIRIFLRECAEITCGLAMDLVQGIRKNRVKIRTLSLRNLNRKVLIEKLIKNKNFKLLDRHDRWLKFTWSEGQGLFKRMYFGEELLILAADETGDIIMALSFFEEITEYDSTEVEWIDGIFLLSPEDEEEIQMEIMYDKYLDEWLSLPHPELADLTPVEAIKDIRGRVLLENLLSDLEMRESRAKSRGEYYYPTSVIRKQLGLDKNKVYKELFHPKAIAVKVEKHRARQLLSPYITTYNWLNEEYATVAATLFDIYINQNMDMKKLAWMLYMWNEFTTVHRPRVSRTYSWIAALEHTLSAVLGEDLSYARVARSFGVSITLVSRNAYIMGRHFQQFPNDFKLEIMNYPAWQDLDNYEMVQSYEEVFQHLNFYAYSLGDEDRINRNEMSNRYHDVVNTEGRFWDDLYQKIYREFFQNHYLLDYASQSGSTIMNHFWDKQASRFPPYLRTAAFNMMMSYVGAYRISPVGKSSLIFEDIFTGEKSEVYGRFGDNVHENIIPGMIGICRLMPLGKKLWVSDPMFIVLNDIQELWDKNLQILMEDVRIYDVSDYRYLKNRGDCIVKAYIISVDEFEKEAVTLINQPLQLDWQYAYVLNQFTACELLNQSKHFRPLYQDNQRCSFMWDRFFNCGNYQWGYLLIEDNTIVISAPPGKDLELFTKDVRRVFKCRDILMAFRTVEAGIRTLKKMENYMVADLAEFFDKNPALSLAILKQDSFKDEESEWQQGMFLLRFGALLMDYLESRESD